MKALITACAVVMATSTPLLAQSDLTDPATLMSNCERIASGRLGTPIGDVRVELQTARVDGSIPVNGNVVGTDITFQCNFDAKGMPGEFWNSKDIKACPGDLTEADRWLFPGC